MKILTLVLLFTLLAAVDISAQVSVVGRFDLNTSNTIPDKIFGINVFQGFDPNQAGFPGNANYKKAMSEMNPGIIRYHSWEMLGTGKNGWLDADKNWAEVKISNALKDSYPSKPLKMMNIPSWPNGKFGVSSDEPLPVNKYDEFANWCAELVRICNVTNSDSIEYWEVLNERDNTYTNNHAELATIFNRCAEAMKAVDPGIKVGGPAFAQAWVTSNLEAFCKGTAATLDFITYHSYSNGNSNETNQNVYNSADIGWVTGTVKNAWKKYSSRPIEYFHDEYNISYNPPDTKQTNYVSQIFDAIATISLIKAGASGAMAWNECDGWYGKMDNSYKKRPSFYMFQNFNKHLTGNRINNVQVSDPKKVVAIASNNDSCYYLTIVNRSDSNLDITLEFKGLSSEITVTTIVENFENQKSGGIITKVATLDELIKNGYLSGAGTIALFRIPKSKTTGINQENSKESIRFYPNPVVDNLTVELPENINSSELLIKDITGRILYHTTILRTKNIDFSTYSNGLYLIEYCMEGKNYTQKIVKY